MYNIFKNTKILVTGGAGFIGSHLTEKLVNLGAKVSVADNLSRGSIKNLNLVKNKIKLYRVDLSLEKNALLATKNQEMVFNLAAINTGVDYDIGRTEYMFEENLLLQIMPIRAAAKNGVKRFIQVSSASIYSTVAMEKRIPTQESDDGGEPEKSKLGYALAKKMGENLARWYNQDSQMKTVIARFINVYGKGDNFDNMGHFIPVVIRKFLHAKNKSIEVFGSGHQKRSFLDVNDAVDALILLACAGKNGEAYNIDSHDEHTVKQLVYQIQKDLHKSDFHIFFNKLKPAGSKRRILDNTKILKLGWQPHGNVINSIPDLISDISARDRVSK
jgi:nucleoside-diphosphate-sugar epimerase